MIGQGRQWFIYFYVEIVSYVPTLHKLLFYSFQEDGSIRTCVALL